MIEVSEAVRDSLAERLEETPAGPALGSLLASIDRTGLSSEELLAVARARQRLIAHQEAELLADLHRVARVVPDQGPQPGRRDLPGRYPWAEVECAMALRWTHGRASARLHLADELIDRLPAVYTALRSGEIDMPKALIFTDLLERVDDRVAAGLVAKVIDKAPGQTTGELRARLRRLVLAADAEAITKRARQEITDRRVVGYPQEHNQLGMLAGYDLAPQRVAAAMERLDAIARAAKAAGDTRTTEQLRADAYLDLLVGDGIATGGPISHGGLDTSPAANPTRAAAGATPRVAPRPGVVELQVPLTTLMGLSDLPGELTGWGPVLADITRQVVAAMPQARWRFSVYNRLGELVHHGTTTRPASARPTASRPPPGRPPSRDRDRSRDRKPDAALAAFVKTRDRTCRAPGCRQPARRCDLDHTTAWTDGGTTEAANLNLLCRRHHLFKHTPGTQLHQLDAGTLLWQTPTGTRHTTRPDPPLLDNQATGVPQPDS